MRRSDFHAETASCLRTIPGGVAPSGNPIQFRIQLLPNVHFLHSVSALELRSYFHSQSYVNKVHAYYHFDGNGNVIALVNTNSISSFVGRTGKSSLIWKQLVRTYNTEQRHPPRENMRRLFCDFATLR